MAQQIQFRRGTSSEWAASNPILAQGEFGLDITVNKFKIGTGVTSWNYLNYGADFVSYASTAGISTVAQGLSGTPNISVGIVTASRIVVSGGGTFTGIVTATSFSGSGNNLTGIVTSIVAGSNVSISTSTGAVTISISGGGGGGVSEANVIAYSIALG